MIFGQFVSDEEGLSKIEGLREEIFGYKNCDLTGLSEIKYLLLLEDGIPVGETVVAYKDLRLTITEIGVKEERRFEHYGDFMVRMIADLAIYLHVRYIYSHVTEDSLDFFLSEHFEEVEGDLYRLDPESLRCACSRNKFNPYANIPCASLKLH